MKYVVDSNLLILLVVGTLRFDWIGKRSHVKNFTIEDFWRLSNLIDQSDGIILVPHAVTEAANLAVKQVIDPMYSEIRSTLKAIIDESEEIAVTSRAAAGRREYPWLGLTDAAILEAITILEASKGGISIATTDGSLAKAAWTRGWDVAYFALLNGADRH